MLEEDIHFFFSANESYIDLVLTFELEIDHAGETILDTLDQRYREGYRPVVPHDLAAAYREEQEERGEAPKADSAVPMPGHDKGDTGGDSEGNGSEQSFHHPTLF